LLLVRGEIVDHALETSGLAVGLLFALVAMLMDVQRSYRRIRGLCRPAIRRIAGDTAAGRLALHVHAECTFAPCRLHDTSAMHGEKTKKLLHRGRGMRSAVARMAEMHPMHVTSLLSPELILPAIAARSKTEVLATLAAHVGTTRPQIDGRLLEDALHERERQSTTALENGIAIPHVRLTGLPAPLAVLARSIDGIDCGAVDGRPTHLFLLLVAAAEQPGGHLKVLASAARLLGDAGCRASLLAAPSADELLAAVRTHELRAHRRAA
jgi:PTS system nitrogen regulatory IIA component